MLQKKNKEKVIVGPLESMSKSKKNIIDPEDMINAYGADAVRLFILSDSPPERDINWSQDGVAAAFKFIQKLWRLNNEIFQSKDFKQNNEDEFLIKSINKNIFNVTKNLENFQYNVVVANIYEIYNIINQCIVNKKVSNKTLLDIWEKVLLLLMPVIPHFSNECWLKYNKDFYWPHYEASLLKETDCMIVVQINGKKRGIFKMAIDSKEDLVIKNAKNIDNVSKNIKDKMIKKNVYIKNKLVNFII